LLSCSLSDTNGSNDRSLCQDWAPLYFLCRISTQFHKSPSTHLHPGWLLARSLGLRQIRWLVEGEIFFWETFSFCLSEPQNHLIILSVFVFY
uniref:Uncharacterized protein n=1 Tax=Poecilia reticulata TaxID=8081 RepID=A0A3P9NIQ9_POERE